MTGRSILKAPGDLLKSIENFANNDVAQDVKEQIKLDSPVKTGRLRDSYKSEPDDGGTLIYTDVEYANYVENGTVSQPARKTVLKAIYKQTSIPRTIKHVK